MLKRPKHLKIEIVMPKEEEVSNYLEGEETSVKH